MWCLSSHVYCSYWLYDYIAGLVFSLMFTFFAVAVPLTLENITKALQRVEWRSLCHCLCVSDTKKLEIESKHPNKHHRRVLAEWLHTDPAPSWRRLIQTLDCYYQDVADNIRHNAEPVQGMLSTYTLFIL